MAYLTVGDLALVALLAVLAVFLVVFMLAGIVCTVLEAARSTRDWLKLGLLAEKALPSGVMTLDQLVSTPKEDKLDG